MKAGIRPVLVGLGIGAAAVVGWFLPLDLLLALLVLLAAMLGLFFSIGAMVTTSAGAEGGGTRRAILLATALSVAMAGTMWARVLIVPGMVQEAARRVFDQAVAFQDRSGRPPVDLAELGLAQEPEHWGVMLHYEVLPGDGTPAGDTWLLWFEEPVWWSRWQLYGPRTGNWVKLGVKG